MLQGVQSEAQVTSWLIQAQLLVLSIHVLGIACFAYIVAKRLVPLMRAERDPGSTDSGLAPRSF